ncbi:MAG: hypothetical protein Q4D60_09380 [Eubacteriales bacterium]|nr:hypothetical protein [Eubacteriales bacterium]
MRSHNVYQKIKNVTQRYIKWKRESKEKWWGKLCQAASSLVMAVMSVCFLMYRMCREIPFSYEVNDDATVVQILDGSYTGMPDGHAVFVRYPLSWVIQKLYERNPQIPFFHAQTRDMNWYIAVLVILSAVALAAVLFQMMQYFQCNRILLCAAFNLGFVMIWGKCFFNLTFSTVAAFFGCSALLFFGFLRKEVAWRPWNLMMLGLLMTASWCLRKQCFYMVLPFLAVELLTKYHIHFFKSVKPWVVLSFCGILMAGVISLDGHMYASQQWKQYFIYNHARAWLQDYKGFPEYEEEKNFYDSLGIDEAKRNAMARYTYCLVDDFRTEWVEKTYQHCKEKQPESSWKERWASSEKTAQRYLKKMSQTDERLKVFCFYFWIVLIPLGILTVIVRGRRRLGELIRNMFRVGMMAVLVWAEWMYLAMNGRFPQRVEEAIRLLTLSVGLLLTAKLLHMWKDAPFVRWHALLQILLLAVWIHPGVLQRELDDIRGIQEYNLRYASEKSEVLEYCGAHPEALYILDTPSFTKMSRPQDNLRQGNWFMSGSWAAYTPLYHEKLSGAGTQTLGSSFLLRDNVYLITKGKKNVASILGYERREAVQAEIVDEIATSGNYFFEVYKIKGVSGKNGR